MGLAELAARVATREISAREMVGEAFRRIERLDAELHAVVALREEALDDARALDDALATGAAAGPLAGLPVLVKDVTDVAGMRTTFGSRWFAEASAAAADGLVPARLRAAGAVVVGKTNTPEFATEAYTSNLLFGTTGNPWRRDAAPGGSSGGSAAALAAGMVPIATAADGGGSVRIPAAWCGLVGLKPTNGMIGRDPVPDWIDFSTDGPIGTTVADVRLLLGVMAGPVAGDPTALPGPLSDVGSPVARLFAIERWADWGPLPPDVADPFERGLERLQEVLGLTVERVDAPGLFGGNNLDDDWFVIAGAEHAHHLGRERIEGHADELHPATRRFVEDGMKVSFGDYVAARRRRFGYVRALDELLGDDGLICSPVMAISWCPADGLMLGAHSIGLPSTAYVTQAQNMTGHPAVSLPAGRSADVVPFGLQITGPRFRDHLVLDVAAAWERAEAWPLVADGYTPFDPTGGNDGG
jgi:Asp-tRNA(Asn)/Glu-tRNA(Gln) amidotransferase A subunit family amidase